MAYLHRIAAASCLLLAGAAPSWAQPAIGLTSSTAPFNLYGLTFTVGACIVMHSSSSGTNCAAADHLELVPVANPGRGNIGLEVIGYSGAVGGATSNALTQPSPSPGATTSSLQLQLNVTPNSSIANNTTKVTSAAYSATGTTAYTCQSGKSCAAQTATDSYFGPGLAFGSLMATLAQQALTPPPSPQTVNVAAQAFSAPTATFTTFEYLSLNSANTNSGYILNFNNTILTFRTTPEPVSASLLAVGALGAGAARRFGRRGRRASA